ncbi:MAG: hypothetical protein KKD17_00515 [Nanoarchaeota archaeon]|nr:hypothetical protein [Nanoarchaeota archaeon]
MPFFSQVMVNCKHCGKPAPSNEMSLDPVYRMMVCRKCVEERRMKDNPIRPGMPLPPKPGIAPSRPAPLQAVKPAVMPKPVPKPAPSAVKVLSSSSKSKIKCKKCGWSFNFDADKGYPRNCPSCGTPVGGGKYDFF